MSENVLDEQLSRGEHRPTRAADAAYRARPYRS